MKFTLILFIVFALSGCSGEQTVHSSNLPEMLEIEIGGTFPVKAAFELTEKYPLPYYSFRAPLSERSDLPFSDYSVSVMSESHRIRGIVAERAYENYRSCNEALESTKKIVAEAHPEFPSSAKSQPFRKGDLIITLQCSTAEGAYYPVLFLSLVSDSLTKQLERQFDR